MEESTVMAGLLHDIGLSTTETEVYLKLLKISEITASDLSDEVSNSRTHVYDTLDELVEKGLVTYTIKNGKRYYSNAHPRKLVDYLSEKKNRIEEQREQMLELVPEFVKLQASGSKRPRVELFGGEEGFKTLTKDILKNNLNFLVLNASSGVHKAYTDVLKPFYRARKRAKIKARMVYPEGSGIIETPLDRVKFMPKEMSMPLPIYIYGHNVAIVLTLEELTIMRVTNPEFSRAMARRFEKMWKSLE